MHGMLCQLCKEVPLHSEYPLLFFMTLVSLYQHGLPHFYSLLFKEGEPRLSYDDGVGEGPLEEKGHLEEKVT